MEQVIEHALYRSSRPGYPAKQVGEAEVAVWCQKAKNLGIQTIICLLGETQLAYYEGLPTGLLGFYEQAGFKVIPRPVADHQVPAVSPEVLAIIQADWAVAREPVLVHCSAGVDRTGKVIEHLLRCQRLSMPSARGGRIS